ncbi:hypothetical protein OROMI_015566 [Orobanche minor]
MLSKLKREFVTTHRLSFLRRTPVLHAWQTESTESETKTTGGSLGNSEKRHLRLCPCFPSLMSQSQKSC